jgi:glycosyltransferase involved in cell wall biosynthesis
VAPETEIVFAGGRVESYKGFHVLVEAAALLRERGVDAPAFAICGDGHALPALRERVQALGLSNVHFLGKRRDVPLLTSSATVSVVPSLWAEAFGLTVVEAMAAGVPVVATRTGGIPELVEPGETGLLVPPGDAAALADALQTLLARPELRARIAERALRTVHERFSMERTIESLRALVSRELARRERRAGTRQGTPQPQSRRAPQRTPQADPPVPFVREVER